jgi:hypothetical protein
MDDPPSKVKFEFTAGPTTLAGSSLRSFVVTTLFHIGRTMKEAERLWTEATGDPGPTGDEARQIIEKATDIRITIETGSP